MARCGRARRRVKSDSGLEILGAIQQIAIENGTVIEQNLGASGKDEVEEVIAFVDSAFGR